MTARRYGTLTMRTLTFTFPVASLLLVGTASAQYVEARNAGMGGVGTASSHYLAAGWANPALLTRHREDDDFGLILPTLGATAYDKDGLIDDINDFVDEYDRVEALGSPTQNDLNGLADRLEALDNRQVTGTLGVGVMLAIPSRRFGFALHVKSFGDLQSFLNVDPNDVAALRNPASVGTLPTIQSEARVVGVAVSELGMSMATSFGDEGSRLSLGVTPKYQQVDTFNYGVTADNFDDGQFDDDQYRNDDSAFNVDLGVAWEIEGGLTLGATGRNLIDNTYTTVDTLGQAFTYDVNPTATVGAAWRYGMLTLGGDLDVIVADRFAQDDGLGKDDVRMARVGAELDLWRWLQLRAGYQTDLEDTLDDAITAGLGISPFDVLHLGVAGTYIDDNSYGGVVQLGLTF
jgi:hypothetical protein